MTKLQIQMLREVNDHWRSVDGLRISGAGDHCVASSLEELGYVRVTKVPKGGSWVCLTIAGRLALRKHSVTKEKSK